MDTDKIMGLVRMEVLIYRYYNQLCQREIMKQYGPGFTNFIELLKMAIEIQDEIVNTSNIEELLFSTDSNQIKEHLKYCNKELNIDNVVARLSILSTNKLVSKGEENGLFVANKEQISAKYIAMGEAVNIQLSFIDEYLSQVNSVSLRKILCEYKYFLIYVMGTGIEKELINRYYHTEPSIYLTSYLEAKVKNIPASYIDAGKKEFAHKTLDSSQSSAYKLVLGVDPDEVACNSFYGQDLVRTSISLRSDLLLLDDKDFVETLDKFGVKKDSAWYKVFLSDRERHKTVTLGHGKIR